MAGARKLAELFYEIRARTEGFEKDLNDAERQAGKFTDYLKRNPLAVAGSIGAALVGVAIQATRMAADMEKSLKQVERSVPGALGQLQGLKDTITDIAREAPRSQQELADAAAAIAKQGVGSTEELADRLRAVTRAADATGEDLQVLIGGLDQTLDLFGMTGAQAEQVLAQLYASTQGKLPLADMFGALQAAAPTIKDLNLDFRTAAGALGQLLEQGKSAKQAASELKEYGTAGKAGAAAIRELAAEFNATAGAATKYDAAIAKSRSSVEASAQIVKNNFSAVMLELGERILPTVTRALGNIVQLLDKVNGSVDRIEGAQALATLATLGPQRDRLNASDRGRLRDSLGQAARQANAGTLDTSGFSPQQLLQVMRAVNAEALSMSASARRGFLPLQEALAKAAAAGQQVVTTSRQGAVETASNLKTVQKAGEDAAKALEEANKRAADQARAAQQETVRAAEALQREVIRLSRTLTDDVAADWDNRIATARKAGNESLAKQWEQMKLQAVGLQQALEQLDRIKPKSLTDLTGPVPAATEKAKRDVAEFARGLQQAVDGALQLVDAFTGIDSAMLSALRSLGQMVGNLPALMKAIDKFKRERDKQDANDKTANPLGALGGVIGSALPIAGAAVSLVQGFMASRKAAQEHAKAMAEAARRVQESMDTLAASFRGTGGGVADALSAIDEKVIKARADIDKLGAPKTAAESRRRDALEAQFRDEVLPTAEAARRRVARDFEQSLQREFNAATGNERGNKLLDLNDWLNAQVRDLDQLLSQGIIDQAKYDALNEQILTIFRRRAEDIQKAEEEAAKAKAEEEAARKRAVARRQEDERLRIAAADGETPEERAARVAAEHRREIEDALAEGADEATIALIRLRQAAEDAADAAARAAEAQRALEDLQVEVLRAKGQSGAADDLAFNLAWQRRREEAVAAGRSPEYLAMLAELEALQRTSRAGGGAADGAAVAGTAGVSAGAGETSAISSGARSLTDQTGNRMADYLASQLLVQRAIYDLLRTGIQPLAVPQLGTGVVGQGAPVMLDFTGLQVTLNNYGQLTSEEAGRRAADALVEQVLNRLDSELGGRFRSLRRLRGIAT